MAKKSTKKSAAAADSKGSKGASRLEPTTGAKWAQDQHAAAAEIRESDAALYGGGLTTVASLLKSGSREARTRQEIYDKWAQMEADPICSAGIKLLVTAALGGHETTGDIVFLEQRPGFDGAQQQDLVKAVRDDLADELNRIAYPVSYLAAVFGDAYARLYSDNRGVQDIYIEELVRPALVQPFDRGTTTVGYAVYTGERNFERLDATQMARMKLPRTQWVPQYGVVEKAMRLAISQDDLQAIPLMPAMAGGSLLYPAEGPYDNLAATLLGLVGQRWLDSIDEQMVSVNLSGMGKVMQDRFLTSITDMLKRSKSLAEQAVAGGRPVMERIRHVIPIWDEKQVTTLSTPNGNGRANSLSIDDVMMHARLLAGAIGVDLSMIGFADQLSGGLGEGGFFRVSAQAAESARIIRVALARMINHIIDIHTLKRYGVVYPPSARPWKVSFYGSISALEAERQKTLSDGMTMGMSLVQAMQGLKDLGADVNIMRAFLTDVMQLDEEQASLYAKVVEAKPPDGGAAGGEGAPDGAV